MPARFAGVFVATLCLLLLSPFDAGAVKYLDSQFHAAKGVETCFDLDDLFRFQINFGPGGMEATLDSEADLVEFFVKLYGCPLLHDPRLPYSRQGGSQHYFLVSINNRGSNGSFRTLLTLLKFEAPVPVYLSNTPVLYRSLAAARSSKQFRDMVRTEGRDQVFVEGLDYRTKTYLGLFDADGQAVPLDRK